MRIAQIALGPSRRCGRGVVAFDGAHDLRALEVWRATSSTPFDSGQLQLCIAAFFPATISNRPRQRWSQRLVIRRTRSNGRPRTRRSQRRLRSTPGLSAPLKRCPPRFLRHNGRSDDGHGVKRVRPIRVRSGFPLGLVDKVTLQNLRLLSKVAPQIAIGVDRMRWNIKPALAVLILVPVVLCAGTANARSYDCSKPGNASKATCKPAAQPAPVAASAPSSTPAAKRNYDCSKPGNANKAICKGAAPLDPATRPTVASKPATVAPAQPAASTPTPIAAGPQGASARCKDGSFSHAAHHSGACSHHGGVAQFFQ